MRFTGSSEPRPPTGAEKAPPRPLAGESAPLSPKRVEAPHPQGQEGAPEPPGSRVEGDPITISDGSGGDGTSRDVRPMDEEAQTSHVVGRTSWPAGLRSIEEQRKKEEEDREHEARRQQREEQQMPPAGGEAGQPSVGPQLEGTLERDRRQEPQGP